MHGALLFLSPVCCDVYTYSVALFTMSEQFSNEELIPPPWLDTAFFARALRSYKRDASITVKDVTISPGTEPGEHFSSIMFRATVVYCSANTGVDDTMKVILKTIALVEGQKVEDAIQNSPLFKNESKIYSLVLPEMEKALRMIGDTTTFAPQLIYQNIHSEPSPVIVLKDITPDGFKVSDNYVSDWNVAKLLIKKMAKFHAVSMYLNESVSIRHYGSSKGNGKFCIGCTTT